MNTMLTCCKVAFIKVSWVTVLTDDMRYSTTPRYSTYGSINALLQRELWCHTFQIFSTKCCVIIRQEQLLVLRVAGQCVSNNVQWPFAVHYGYGQYVHTFQPSGLAMTQIWLCPNIYPRLMISIYCCGYDINVTPPFNARLVYGQQFFLSPTIVAFCWSVLADMVSNWMETVVGDYMVCRIPLMWSANGNRNKVPLNGISFLFISIKPNLPASISSTKR